MLGFGMGFGLIFLVLIFGGVILLGLWMVKALFPNGQKPLESQKDRELPPEEILDLRYARGEITRDQYDQMKQDLIPGS